MGVKVIPEQQPVRAGGGMMVNYTIAMMNGGVEAGTAVRFTSDQSFVQWLEENSRLGYHVTIAQLTRLRGK